MPTSNARPHPERAAHARDPVPTALGDSIKVGLVAGGGCEAIRAVTLGRTMVGPTFADGCHSSTEAEMNGVEVTYPGERVAVVALQGEHERFTEQQLAALLADAVADNDLVVVDVSDAEFVDASFLHNLVTADRAATERGSRFVLQIGTAYIVRRALEISGLLETLDVVHSRDEAVASHAAAG